MAEILLPGFFNALTPPPPRDALEQFLKAKTDAGYRKSYIRSLRQVVGCFLHSQTSVHCSTKNVSSFLASKKWNAAALRGNIGRLASFFTFCKKQQWIELNPCDCIEMPKVADRVPFVLDASQNKKILEWTLANKPKLLAVAVLEIMLGVRPFEVQRIGWECVQIDARRVVIDAAASKVWRRRIIPIDDESLRWLTVAESKKAILPVSHSTRRRFLKLLRELLGFNVWPQDSLRHTAATNMLRRVEDAGKVARWLGNSEKILLKNYADI